MSIWHGKFATFIFKNISYVLKYKNNLSYFFPIPFPNSNLGRNHTGAFPRDISGPTMTSQIARPALQLITTLFKYSLTI